jgi:hypothetical protein
VGGAGRGGSSLAVGGAINREGMTLTEIETSRNNIDYAEDRLIVRRVGGLCRKCTFKIISYQ